MNDEYVYIESVFEKMSSNFLKLKDEKKITADDIILIYGMTSYSYAIRTLVRNLGYRITGYVENDDHIRQLQKNKIEAFRCRYLNSDEEIIEVLSVEDISKYDMNKVRILYSDTQKDVLKHLLMSSGLVEDYHYFCLFDFQESTIFDIQVSQDKKMSLQEIQMVQLELLKYFDAFCSEHQIRYYIFYGTLLGAIRHKGFIPWDDDVDVVMPYGDYVKFLSCFADNENYRLEYAEKYNYSDYMLPFAKLTSRKTILRDTSWQIRRVGGVSLDVFPLLGQSNSLDERRNYAMRLKEKTREMRKAFYSCNGNMNRTAKYVCDLERYYFANDDQNTEWVGCPISSDGDRDCYKKEWLGEPVSVRFENIDVKAPVDSIRCLEQMYGNDWCMLPPISERAPHNCETYWKG